MRHTILSTLLLTVLLMTVTSQKTEAQQGQAKLKSLLVKMQRAYQQASYLEFQVAYFYANQKLPGQRIDSLFGNVQMDKNRCRFAIDNTETVVTDKYTIQVMKKEKTIYLSGARHSGMMDPVGITDSILAHMEGVQAEVEKQGASEMLTLNFPPGKMYTRITMMLDGRTGFLQRVTYDLHTASLVGQEMIDKPGHPGPYQSEGQVDVLFSGYRNGSFGDAAFDEKKFFNHVENRFEPAGAYKDYHIFLASSNL
jgi:hypothetical protein